MSVCKGGVGSSTKKAPAGSRDSGGTPNRNTSSLSGEGGGDGKENASSGHRLHMFSGPSPSKAKAGGSKSGGGGDGSGGCKEDAKSDATTAFDLMPPPLPRTPGKGKGAPSRSSVLSPLGRHDPNLRQPSASGDGNAAGRGRAAEKVRGHASFSLPVH